MRLHVVFLLTLMMGGGGIACAGDEVSIEEMHVELMKTDDAGEKIFVPAPEALTEMTEGEQTWWRVSLPDPAPLKPWCQHVGLIVSLKTPIPVGRPWRVIGRARSVSGARGLSILRRWGGSRPWRHVALTDEWQEFEFKRTAAKNDTQDITISLVANPQRRLQPCAKGTFDLADLRVEMLPEEEAAPAPGE